MCKSLVIFDSFTMTFQHFLVLPCLTNHIAFELDDLIAEQTKSLIERLIRGLLLLF